MEHKKRALLVIDMQYDFMLGGSLEVKDANELIDPINNLMKLDWNLIVASKDWHPKNHISFAVNHTEKKPFEKIMLSDGTTQVLWPDHCIQNSHGAEIHDGIDKSLINKIVFKGQNTNIDSYSAFFDNNHAGETELDSMLKSYSITDIYTVGLAADYCVKFTAIDGQQLGYNSYFVSDATKSVNPELDTSLIQELEENKVSIITTDSIA